MKTAVFASGQTICFTCSADERADFAPFRWHWAISISPYSAV